MKTEETINIERALLSYDPANICGIKVNKFRPRIKRFEVPVTCGSITDGLVDCLASIEVIINMHKTFVCGRDEYKKFLKNTDNSGCEKYSNLCKTEKVRCSYQYTKEQGDCSVLLIAYEIKVSKQDFHSSHGHNFCGHMNFYVMPMNLYKEVKPEIPDNVGVIAFLKNGSLRKVKDAVYNELSEESQKWLILSLLKKKEWKEKKKKKTKAPHQERKVTK